MRPTPLAAVGLEGEEAEAAIPATTTAEPRWGGAGIDEAALGGGQGRGSIGGHGLVRPGCELEIACGGGRDFLRSPGRVQAIPGFSLPGVFTRRSTWQEESHAEGFRTTAFPIRGCLPVATPTHTGQAFRCRRSAASGPSFGRCGSGGHPDRVYRSDGAIPDVSAAGGGSMVRRRRARPRRNARPATDRRESQEPRALRR